MYVTNDQSCTLIIGGVKIAGGESKPIPKAWEQRCEELGKAGALRVTTSAGPVSRPAKDRADALLSELSDVERAELLSKYAPKASDKALVAGAPEDFAGMNWKRAKQWVEECNDAKLLDALGSVEQRQSVLSAIIDRIGILEEAAKPAETEKSKD